MYKQIMINGFSVMIKFRFKWDAWLIGFDWIRPMRREDGVKHTPTEAGIYFGPAQLNFWW